MALHAVAVGTSAPAPRRTPAAGATITELRPAPRQVAVAAARRERRKWMAVGIVVFATPFLASLAVLEVIH